MRKSRATRKVAKRRKMSAYNRYVKKHMRIASLEGIDPKKALKSIGAGWQRGDDAPITERHPTVRDFKGRPYGHPHYGQ